MSIEYEFSQRLMRLREKKQVAARTRSVDIGLNPGYIHDIECGKSLPSLPIFLKICNYLEITPGAFLETETENPAEIAQLVVLLKQLDKNQLAHLTALVQDLTAVHKTAK